LFTDSGAKDRKIDRRIGIAILASYVMNYGPFEIERLKYWPLAAKLAESLGDLVQMNTLLQSTSHSLETQEAT
jgi:hypothetical protein